MKKLLNASVMFFLLALLLCMSVGAQENIVEHIVCAQAFDAEGYPAHSPRFSDVELLEDDVVSGLADYIEEKLPSIEVPEENFFDVVGYYYAEINLDDYYEAGGSFIYNELTLQTTLDELAYALNYKPSLFYVKSVGVYAYDSATGRFPYIRIYTSIYGDELNEQREFYCEELEKLVEMIPEELSDFEKVLWLNDYICVNYEYDTSFVIHDVYNFFKTGIGVCESYAKLFVAVMDELGIPADYCTSDVMNHMWNYVQLDGNWYHIDITWNDPVPNTIGRSLHTYFLLSDAFISNSDIHGGNVHTNFGAIYECTDTTYDAIGMDYDSAFVYKDDLWYFTAYEADNYSAYLYSTDDPYFPTLDVNNCHKIKELGIWLDGATNFYYPGSFSYPALLDEYIFFNDAESVYISDGDNVDVFFTPDFGDNLHIYAFDIKDSAGRLILSEKPDAEYMNAGKNLAFDIDTVSYLDEDGSTICDVFITPYNTVPSFLVPENPEKESDEYYSYEFSAWEADENGNFVATFDKIPINDVTIIEDSLEYYNKHEGSKIKFAFGLFKHIGHHAFDDDSVTAIILPDDVEDVQEDSFVGVPNAMIYLSRRNQKLHNSLVAFNLMQHRYLEDINFDRKIDILDFTTLVENIVHHSQSNLDFVCADIDEDNAVGLKDVRALVRTLASDNH